MKLLVEQGGQCCGGYYLARDKEDDGETNEKLRC